MSLDLGTLTAHLGLDVAALQTGGQQATQVLLQVEQQGQKTGAEADKLAGKLKTALAIPELAGLSGQITGAMQQVGKLGAEAQRAFQLMQSNPQQLAATAKAAGISVEALQKNLQEVVKRAEQAGLSISDIGPAASEMAAEATQSLADVQEQGEQTGGAADKLAEQLKTALAVGAIVGFGRAAIDAASDLNETLNKSQVIFGQQAAAMEKWGDTAATSVGLSKAAALEAAAGFGDMFSQLGFTGTAAADMSKQVVQMSADLGSFNNLGTDGVLERISAAMRGEYDSLQALIPNINAARVEQEALAETGKKSADSLTAQEKATATLAIIQKDGAKAAGDFAKTSDGLANKQKIAAAEIENTKAKIGQGLLPVMSTTMDLVRDVGVPALQGLATAVGLVAGPITALVEGFGALPGPIKLAVVGMVAFALFGTKIIAFFKAMPAQAAKMRLALTTGLGPLSVVLGVVAGAALLFGTALNDTKEKAEESRARMEDLKGTLNQVTGAFTGATVAKLTDQLSGFDDALKHGGTSAGEVAAAIGRMQVDGGRSLQALKDLVAKSFDWSAIMAGPSEETAKAFQTFQSNMATAGVSVDEWKHALVTGGEGLDSIRARMESVGVSGDVVNRFFQQQEAQIGNLHPEWKALADAQAGATVTSEQQRAEFGRLVDSAAATSAGLGSVKVSSSDLGDALAKGQQSGKSLAEVLSGLGLSTKQQAAVTEILGDKYGTTTAAADTAAAANEAVASSADTAASAIAGQSSALESAAGKVGDWKDASDDAADAQSRLSEMTDEVKASLDELNGRVPTITEATKDLEQNVDDLAEGFKKSEDGTYKFSDALNKNRDGLDLSTQGGRDLYDQLQDTSKSMIDVATATYQNSIKQGDLAGASGKAKAAIQGQYVTMRDNLSKQLGLTTQQTDALLKKMGLYPDQITAELKANSTQATTEISTVLTRLATLANTVATATLQVVADTSGASIQIAALKASAAASVAFAVTAVGGRAYGGRIPGLAAGGFNGLLPGPPAPKGVDNLVGLVGGKQPIGLAGQEFVVNREATAKNLGLLMLINSGRIKGFAAGGRLPSAAALAGSAARSLGDREGITVGALDDLIDWLSDVNVQARELTAQAGESKVELRRAREEEKRTRQEQDAAVRETRRQAEADVRRAEAERRQKIADAAADVKAAKTTKERAAAQAEYNKVVAEQDAAVKAAKAGAKRETVAAQDEQRKEVAAAKAKAEAAKRSADADAKAAKAAKAKAAEADKDYRATSRARSLLTTISRNIDLMTTRLASARDVLADRRSALADTRADKASLAGSIAGTIGGYDDGILGHAEQRTSVAAILRGLQFDNAKIAGFGADLTKLKALGLNAGLLQQIAQAGIDGGGATADVLSRASKADIARINSLVAAGQASAAKAGNAVSGAQFDKAIAAQIKAVNAQTAAVKKLEATIRTEKIDATTLASAMSKVFGAVNDRSLYERLRTVERQVARR